MKRNGFVLFIVCLVLAFGACKEKTFTCACTTNTLNTDGSSSVKSVDNTTIKSRWRDDADVTCSQNEISKNAANGMNERTTCILK